MEVLVPKNIFLRVKDKFVPSFIDSDEEVRKNASILYTKLFAECYDTGYCTIPQKVLSAACKFSVRCLQYAQNLLVELKYIQIDHTSGGCNTYVLLLSDRLRKHLDSWDLIDRKGWYPRKSKKVERQPEVSATPAAEAHTPPQTLREGCADFADLSYKEDKKDKKSPNSPLSESPSLLSSDVPPDVASTHEGGESFSASRKDSAHILGAFESLWAAWPVKQARYGALRAFCSLGRSGQLPSVKVLLASVDLMRTSDDRWQRGYVPSLVNWLRDRRWNDSPVIRHSTTDASAAAVANSNESSQNSLVTRVIPSAPALPKLPELSAEAEATVSTLCRIWPGVSSRSPVRAYFRSLLARQDDSPTTISSIVALATAHLDAACSAPGSLVRWLMSEPWVQRSCAA